VREEEDAAGQPQNDHQIAQGREIHRAPFRSSHTEDGDPVRSAQLRATRLSLFVD
jgi:hypothetical protein